MPEAETLERNLKEWLSHVGLGKVNPFEHLDAGADPDLSTYLIRHEVFFAIWDDSPSVVFAPTGGGKSAFRVRLAYACRAGEDQRKVFPILYTNPKPTTASLEEHYEAILRRAALELLLALVYRPDRFEALDARQKQRVYRALEGNAPGLLDHFLPQVKREGSLQPLAVTLDPSATKLPAPAPVEDVQHLCRSLAEFPPLQEQAPAEERFRELIDLLRHVLGFEAIYLMVDGVDAFLETRQDPAQALAVLQPLLESMEVWAGQHLFLKLFLPLELEPFMPNLTEYTKVAIINSWSPESLREVLRVRLRAASRGEFDRLDAIAAPSLRDAETSLIQAITPLPRELLALVNQVILEHVQRVGPHGLLEPEDLEAALRWYAASRPQASSP